MTNSKLLTIFLLFTLSSCGQKSAENKTNPAAIELNNKAMLLVPYLENSDSSRKALTLLEKATTIDSNYFMGYFNKLTFLSQLNQLDKAIETINKLIELKPGAHDLYLYGGFFYERTGDTISSKTYFQKSLEICNQVLDTMSNNNTDYTMLVINKATNLIMLGEERKANESLKNLYDLQTDEAMKEEIKSLMNKTRKELVH